MCIRNVRSFGEKGNFGASLTTPISKRVCRFLVALLPFSPSFAPRSSSPFVPRHPVPFLFHSTSRDIANHRALAHLKFTHHERMSSHTNITPSSESSVFHDTAQSLDGSPSVLFTEPINTPSPEPVKKELELVSDRDFLQLDLESEFDPKNLWKVDPNWVPGPWDDVAYARNIEKESPPPPPPESGLVKQYVCSLCDKSYKRKNDARIHVGEVHLSLYRFFCQYCSHKTSRGWSFDRHLRNVHKVYTRNGKKRSARPAHGITKSRATGQSESRRL